MAVAAPLALAGDEQMAAGANFMLFVPTAMDTYIQAQAINTASAPLNNAPNLALYQIVALLTRTGVTNNSVAGFVYQGDFGLVLPLIDYLRQRLPDL